MNFYLRLTITGQKLSEHETRRHQPAIRIHQVPLTASQLNIIVKHLDRWISDNFKDNTVEAITAKYGTQIETTIETEEGLMVFNHWDLTTSFDLMPMFEARHDLE